MNPRGKKIEFYHQRNLLRDAWYIINEKDSLLDNLKNRWITYQFDGNKKVGKNESVVFSNGGIYLADDLHARAADKSITGSNTFVLLIRTLIILL